MAKGQAVGYQVEITRRGMESQALQFKSRKDADLRFDLYMMERETDIAKYGWRPEDVTVRMYRVYRSSGAAMTMVWPDRAKPVRSESN